MTTALVACSWSGLIQLLAMWVVVQRRSVSVHRRDNPVSEQKQMLMVNARVVADARLGGEVLGYLHADNHVHDVSVVYQDSVTRRVCHVACCDRRGGDRDSWGDQDLWEATEWGTTSLDEYLWFERQDAFVFPDETAARAAVPQLRARYEADLPWKISLVGPPLGGGPVWRSVLPNSPQ